MTARETTAATRAGDGEPHAAQQLSLFSG